MAYILHIFIVNCTFLPTILGYNLVFGRGKILHFGPTGVSLVGGYAIILPLMRWDSYPLALLIGVIAVTVISLLFAWLALRLEGDALGILTIAVHLSLLAIVLNWTSLTQGAIGITHIPRIRGMESLGGFALVAGTVNVLWILFMNRVDRSRLGRSLAALAEHRSYSESLGISRGRTYITAFLIAGLGSLLSAVFFSPYLGILHPNDFALPFLIFYIMCVVAGRPGSVWGVTLATTLLVILKESLRFIPMPYDLIGPLRLVLFGIILIVAVYVRRKELFPAQRTI